MSKIFVLSGAGLSAQSGLKTFRDHDGMWENYDVMEVCSVDGWQKDRQKVTQFYNTRRKDLQDKKPNKMHHFLASLENKYKNDFIHMTQNVDDLCEKAGNKKVIHLHGTLRDLRCEDCLVTWDIGYNEQKNDECPRCASKNVRHNVVMFGEMAPNYQHIYNAIMKAEVFVALGTSSQVIDTMSLAKEVPVSVYLNIKREQTISMFGEETQYIDESFTHKIIAPATQAIDELEEIISENI